MTPEQQALVVNYLHRVDRNRDGHLTAPEILAYAEGDFSQIPREHRENRANGVYEVDNGVVQHGTNFGLLIADAFRITRTEAQAALQTAGIFQVDDVYIADICEARAPNAPYTCRSMNNGQRIEFTPRIVSRAIS